MLKKFVSTIGQKFDIEGSDIIKFQSISSKSIFQIMKIRNPKSRFDLKIKRGSRVLEVGGGNNPHPKSNVVVDKFTESNFHRSGNLKVLENQQFVIADGENLPFKDKEFDYVICCQVLEHVEDPVKFLAEQFRVARMGYLEVPSLIGEHLFPKKSHKWIMHEFQDTLFLVDKQTLGFVYGYDLGELIQDYLPRQSIGYKILQRTHPNMETIRIEWKSDFAYVVEPTDPKILRFFHGKWKLEWANDFFPKKSLRRELKETLRAFAGIAKNVAKSRIFKK